MLPNDHQEGEMRTGTKSFKTSGLLIQGSIGEHSSINSLQCAKRDIEEFNAGENAPQSSWD